MKFNEFVTSRRLKLNLNKKELAKKAKISDAYIKHIEDGIRIPKDMIILYDLADALQVDREWFRDYAYLHRNPKKAVSYIDEQKVNESKHDHADYNTTDSLSAREKEFLAFFRKAQENDRQAILEAMQNGFTSNGLLFRGKVFQPGHTLYRIVTEVVDKDDRFMKKMLDYIVAMVFIETHEQKNPLRDLLSDMLKVHS